MRRIIIVHLLLACLLLVSAVCGSAPRPTSTPSPPAAATPAGATPLPTFTPPSPGEVLPTAPASSEQPLATATPLTAASLPRHPLATRTGLAEVDRVIDVVLMEDRDVLASLIRTETTPCTTREGLGGPPKCAPGESEGTPVEVFPVGGPEGSFVRVDEIDRVLPGPLNGLYAVYKVHEGPNPEPYWPIGDYALVFLKPDNSFLIVRASGQGIVRIDHPPGPAEDLPAWVGTDAVLPPPGG